MADTYEVTRRGPAGEPTEIHCLAHPACPWRMQVEGRRRDDDPILQAQFANHLAQPAKLKVAGHMRRARL